MATTISQDELSALLTAFPWLTYNGSLPPSHERYAEKRRELLNALGEVQACVDWLLWSQPYWTKKATLRSPGPYWLKHVVERWRNGYVAEGSFVAASLLAGVPLFPPGEPVRGVGISYKWVKHANRMSGYKWSERIDKETTPRRFLPWLFGRAQTSDEVGEAIRASFDDPLSPWDDYVHDIDNWKRYLKRRGYPPEIFAQILAEWFPWYP